MASFLITDDHLRRLTPDARREVLTVLGEEIAAALARFESRQWDMDGGQSYPLSLDEAELLVRGMPEPSKQILRVFACNVDGEEGRAELGELLQATGFKHYQQLSQEIAWILLRLRTVTGNSDAWLFNWDQDDWIWDPRSETYSAGTYFISGPATQSLRSVLGVDT